MEPTEYQIVQNLQAALQAIAVASGYHFDVAAAAVKLDPNVNVEALIRPGGPRPFIVIEVKPDSFVYSPASRATLTMPVTIHWVSETTPTDDTSRLLTYFRGIADVERAIVKDVSRGSRAKDTRITKRSYATAVDGSQVWAIVDTDIETRRVYGQPDA